MKSYTAPTPRKRLEGHQNLALRELGKEIAAATTYAAWKWHWYSAQMMPQAQMQEFQEVPPEVQSLGPHASSDEAEQKIKLAIPRFTAYDYLDRHNESI